MMQAPPNSVVFKPANGFSRGFWVALFLQGFKNKPFVSEQDLELSGSLQHAHH